MTTNFVYESLRATTTDITLHNEGRSNKLPVMKMYYIALCLPAPAIDAKLAGENAYQLKVRNAEKLNLLIPICVQNCIELFVVELNGLYTTAVVSVCNGNIIELV